jgi:hypothetical protein
MPEYGFSKLNILGPGTLLFADFMIVLPMFFVIFYKGIQKSLIS